MKYSILGFNQEKVLGLRESIIDELSGKTKVIRRIDVVDLLILQDIADFMNRRNIIKYVIDEKTFFSVKYQVIINDLPILNLKQQALSDRLKKLCDFGLLEKEVVRNQSGSYTAFRIGKVYEDIVYNNEYSITNMENHPHLYLDTCAKVAEYKCYINNNNIDNNNTSTINNKEKGINIPLKKNDYQAIVDCWNEHNGKKLGKVTKLTDKRKKAIKRALDDNDITQEQLMQFFKTLPLADKWLYNPNKQHANWKPDFDWWLANTNGWLTKALEGKVHLENPQAFSTIMLGKDAPYSPVCDGALCWNDYYKCFMYTGYWDGYIPDGYTDKERPDGAQVTLNNGRGVVTWNKLKMSWVKDDK